MDGILNWILAGLLAYLVGGINGSIIGSHIFFRDDIRRHGSGNAGSTNTLRTYGKLPAVFSFAADDAAQIAAVLAAQQLAYQHRQGDLAGSCLLLGIILAAGRTQGAALCQFGITKFTFFHVGSSFLRKTGKSTWL